MSVLPRTESAFAELVEPFRRELHLHCYRIVGSLADADDLVQETFLAAWRGLGEFEGRSSVRTWLYRIATNRCLNALRAVSRRPEQAPKLLEPTRMGEPVWLQPYPDAMLDPVTGPEARYEERESIGLAFTVLLQLLPARQRAAVVLVDVLGFRLAEAAEMLDSTAVAVKGMLARARSTLDAQRDVPPQAGGAREREVAGLFAAALAEGDTDAIVSLLTDDAWLTMPPLPHEYYGPVAIGEFLRDRALARGVALRPVPTRANGQPAFGCYLPTTDGIARPAGIMVLTVVEAGVAAITWFHDTSVFPYFGLPRWV
ncbi:RNA polymerase subunit sigma-70 [Phytomonospora endophytica]|uniref:RNA polymerase sigma factor n=1 Tax=Phytomonospora endophytica TaxID=714109 RepID=A0A841G581_9ACTN|nr:RNA polymerase subunit sigma-70 [Phytomonospora endophytica]MBB6039260.1 RNA polymerase sigma-70 factor (ECF subfamily) [Phytomonospora endophytica]GIG69798.1 RNA polymerase sigma factor [Phytomonospora endophytica]